MTYRFKKHYTREEARALLPEIRRWLPTLSEARRRLAEYDQRVAALLSGGNDAGGDTVNRRVRTLAEIKDVLLEFATREIQIKDLDRGLIDFPAIIGGREVFLCWEQDEEDIEFWHDLESGYAGRERL
ncbi:MAG TPA: DUF2203 domain-containing protein [Verrucomicrobiae bacterium]|nr:DUF2203 domain-containing protein [Verrucomicrobiae bacterium]